MSTRRFTITIHVSRSNAWRGLYSDIAYPGKPAFKKGDEIRFYKQKIVILADRSVNPSDAEILENRTSSLHAQIIKSLLLLYVGNQRRIIVRSLEIKKGLAPSTLYSIDVRSQPILGDFSLSGPFPDVIKDLILQESVSAKKLRVILTQFLCGLGTGDRYYKFERYWRSYEQLCIWHKYHGRVSRPSDFDSIAAMRAFLVSNPALLLSSLVVAGGLTFEDLRDDFAWYQYVDNEYPTPGTSALYANYKDYFVRNYTDYRIMQLHQLLLPYREERLKSFGQFAQTDAHIKHYVTLPNICNKNEELVAFLCGRYSYFLRNKMFHGEIADFTFRFYSKIKEDHTVDVLNGILQAVSEDLLKSFNLL